MSDDHAAIFRTASVFIYRHIDEPLPLARIAAASGTTLSTLKRAFESTLGLTPGALVRRLRMELAFRTLACREQSILEVALAAGFEDHSAFTRGFRRAFGYAPSRARNVKSIQRELEQIELAEPELVVFEPFTIQSVTCTGYYFECAPRAWRELTEKLTAAGNEDYGLFVGAALDDPHRGDGSEHQVRFSAGVHGAGPIAGTEPHRFEGGTYARFRFDGKIANIGLAYHYIYGAWASEAHRKLRDEPAVTMLDSPPTPFETTRVLIALPLAE
jgi:AraC family transcriptional regulator